MSDPLLVLRDTLLQNSEAPQIVFLDNTGNSIEDISEAEYIRLGATQTFVRQAPTNFKSKRGTGPCYTLDAVVFVLRHRDDSFSVYLQEARRKGLPVVSLVDKKDLVDYLTTAGAASPYVDHSEPLPAPIKGFKYVKGSSGVTPSQAQPGKLRQLKTRKSDFVGETSFAFLHSSIKAVLGIKEHTELKKEKQKEPPQKSKSGKSLIDQISSMNKPKPAQAPVATEIVNKKNGIPIIVLSNAPSSLITLYNVKEWLEQSKFVSSSDAKAAASAKPSSVTVTHQFDGQSEPLQFLVIDTPCLLSSQDWQRVVGAIVLGNTWQFKGWKWSSPADIFSNLAGFYVQWEDVQCEPVVQQWNVRRINVSRNKRHLDATAVLEFWHYLGSMLKSKNI